MTERTPYTDEQLKKAREIIAALSVDEQHQLLKKLTDTTPPPTYNSAPKSSATSTTFYSREAEINGPHPDHAVEVKVHHVVAHALAQLSLTNWDGDLATASLSIDPLDGALCVEVMFCNRTNVDSPVVFALEMNRLTVRSPNG